MSTTKESELHQYLLSPTAMNKLPSEILDLIILYCDHADQKTCRLVNHDFHRSASDLVFEHVYIGYFPHLLESFCQLAKSRWAKRVKKFTICSDLLPDWDRHEWQGSIDLRPEFTAWSKARLKATRQKCVQCRAAPTPCEQCQHSVEGHVPSYQSIPTCPIPSDQLDEAWLRYQMLQASQNAWREDREGKVFVEHFSLLPNIEEASVVGAQPFGGPTNGLPVWKALRRSILVGPDDWPLRSNKELTEPVMEGQAALALLEAIGHRSQFAGTKQIPKLTVADCHHKAYTHMMGATTGHANGTGLTSTAPSFRLRYLNIVETFTHLTNLTLNVCHAASGGEATAQESCDFLRRATQLRSLDLVYIDNEDGLDDTHQDLGHLFGNSSTSANPEPVWPHLQHLALRTTVRCAEFLTFLQSHAKTLRSLELRDMLVGDVQELVMEIRRILDLEHVYLECLWGHAGEAENSHSIPRAACYLIRGTDYDDGYERGVKMSLLRESSQLPLILAECRLVSTEEE